jgi:beta-glucanase (GH16 family)
MPSKSGYTFTPSSRAIAINGASATASFTASANPTTYSISGNISPTMGGAYATVALTGAASRAVTSDSAGNFTFSSLANGTYTVTPVNPGYAFTPANQTVAVNGAGVAGLAFTAAPSGTVWFLDDFAGTDLDTSVWTAIDSPGDSSNLELEYYQPANVSLANSALQLLTMVQTVSSGGATYNYTSGAVQWTSLNFTYGTVEFRAKMAGGKGPWPAIWLLGSNCQTATSPCNWPQAGSDEIDIAEVMNGNLTNVNQQIHSGANNSGCHATTTDVSQNWHTYQLVWAPGSLKWKIDGITTCSLSSGVPSTAMFLIINTAVGGTGGGMVNNATLPQAMLWTT